jgi:NDP-sugar pyrophosphorylase family protein
MNQKMFPVAILAGGLAQRLRPLTERIPKALVEIQGEPFISHQLRLLRASGIRRVILCVGYRGEMIQEFVGSGARYEIEAEFSFDGPRLLGTAGALKKALPLLGESFFVLYGDSYLPCDYRKIQLAFENQGRLALMTVFRNEGKGDQSNVEFVRGEILRYDKKRQTPQMCHIDYGLGMFQKRALEIIPDDQPYDLARLYHDLLGKKELAAYEVEQRFYEIGSFAGIQELNHYLAEQLPGLKELS